MLFPVLGAKYAQRRILGSSRNCIGLMSDLRFAHPKTPMEVCKNASSKKTTEITEIETAKAFPPLPQPDRRS